LPITEKVNEVVARGDEAKGEKMTLFEKMMLEHMVTIAERISSLEQSLKRPRQ
jgi:hypothetical protein